MYYTGKDRQHFGDTPRFQGCDLHTHAHTHVHVHVHTCTRMHTHTHARTHTHTHTHTHTLNAQWIYTNQDSWL